MLPRSRGLQAIYRRRRGPARRTPGTQGLPVVVLRGLAIERADTGTCPQGAARYHLHRYVTEFAGRSQLPGRPITLDWMRADYRAGPDRAVGTRWTRASVQTRSKQALARYARTPDGDDQGPSQAEPVHQLRLLPAACRRPAMAHLDRHRHHAGSWITSFIERLCAT